MMKRDAVGNEWYTEWLGRGEHCTSLRHNDDEPVRAIFQETLFAPDGSVERVEFTCTPCHLILQLGAEVVCG